MAKVAVPVTQPYLTRIGPAPLSRRVIAIELRVPVGIGSDDWCYTPKLGNRLWLFSIDLWVYAVNPPAFVGGFFYLMYGTGRPTSANDIALRWNFICELSCGLKKAFRWYDEGSFSRHLDMARLFTDDELRFAIVAENGFLSPWECTVAFQISEG